MSQPSDQSRRSLSPLKFPHLLKRIKGPRRSHAKQKSPLKRKPRKAKTKSELLHFTKVANLGCIVGPVGCIGRITIHHCGTGAGGRKDHLKVIGLCWEHHLGKNGVDGGVVSKKQWQVKFGCEIELLEKTKHLLKEEI